MVGFLVFTLGPMIASAVLSFTNYDVISKTNWVGLANYRNLIHDPNVSMALKNTAIYTILYVPSAMLVSLFLAMMLARVGRGSGFFRTAFYLPAMTPQVAVGILYLLLFNGDYGLMDKVLGFFHLPQPQWTTDPNWMKPGFVIMNLWSVGANVVIYLAAIRGVPVRLYEAASMDGARAWRRFRDVTLPMISPALLFTFIILTINAIQMFTQAYTAFFNTGTTGTGIGSTATLFYVIYLFQQAFSYLHMGYASALAWLLFGIIAIITAVQLIASRRFVYYEGNQK
ncbi:MAG: Carbohydrate transporter rane protein 1, family [Acidimicrobiaceae bacterium]|nr:Carbohydrate transporter rane protein 1, family [Acidimicrobiaceae bacterium]